jgi:hypothetical protein
MPTFDCQVTWPTDPTQGDLIAPQLRPQHRCVLESTHVHQAIPSGGTITLDGKQMPAVTPHRCHCGSWTPVRDVEPAVQS